MNDKVKAAPVAAEAPATTEDQAVAPAAQVVKMATQNGITQPRPGTACANIWALATAMSTERKSTVAVGDLLVTGQAQGYNKATIKTQYARWRKFHGVEGRVESDVQKQAREAKVAEKAAKQAEKEAAKKAREEEKARKAAEKEEEKKRKAEEKAKAAAEKAKAAEAKAAKAAPAPAPAAAPAPKGK